VQQGGYPADRLEADESRKQENEELYERGGVHDWSLNLRRGPQGLIDAQQVGGDRIVETKLKAGAVGDEMFEQRPDVAAEKSAGVRGHLTWEVHGADNFHAAGGHRLAGLGTAGVAAGLRGEIYDHRAGREAGKRFVGVKPAKMIALGAGVAGLQAIATARRLGAVVHGFDVREGAREQVESLGARFVSPGEALKAQDAANGYAAGDRVQFTDNGWSRKEKEAGLVNGVVGTVLAIDTGHGKPRMTVELDTAKGEQARRVSFVIGPDREAGEFDGLRLGYAGTI
jgi:Alanine dehydrogenase/PNT, C-terminal domain